MARAFLAVRAVRPEPEIRPIPGWEQHYEASSDGRVRRVGSDVWLRPCRLKRGGYLAVGLWRDGKGSTQRVNRLVCAAFHGAAPTPKHDAAHDNGRHEDNRAENLFWKTRAANEADKVRHGSSNRGNERSGAAVLTVEKVLEIRRLAARGLRRGEMARMGERYGISASGIQSVICRRTWKYVEDEGIQDG